MKTLIAFLLIAICWNVEAQTDDNYFVYQYIKVLPADENEYLKLELDVWKKIHSERVRKDLLDGWYLYRVISPNGSKTEYNFVLVLYYDTAEKLAGHFESFGVDYADLLTPEEIAFALKTPEFRDQVYEEVWRTVDQLIGRDDDYRFQVFNAMSLKTDVTAEDYTDMENKYWKPLHRLRMSENRMHGWGLYNMIIPGGTEREYTWGTVDYYDRFIDIMANNDGLMGKIHGSKEVDKIYEKTDKIRDLLRTEIRELIDSMRD